MKTTIGERATAGDKVELPTLDDPETIQARTLAEHAEPDPRKDS